MYHSRKPDQTIVARFMHSAPYFQLLVENIIKHNIISLSKPMNILLDTEDSPLRLVVKNQIRSKQ